MPVYWGKGKAILVGQYGCETLRFPHFLDNLLTDGGGQSYARPLFNPQKDFWYSFHLEAESTPEPYCGWKDQENWEKKFNYLIEI
jgi:hypothetical protein